MSTNFDSSLRATLEEQLHHQDEERKLVPREGVLCRAGHSLCAGAGLEYWAASRACASDQEIAPKSIVAIPVVDIVEGPLFVLTRGSDFFLVDVGLSFEVS